MSDGAAHFKVRKGMWQGEMRISDLGDGGRAIKIYRRARRVFACASAIRKRIMQASASNERAFQRPRAKRIRR